MSGSSRKRHPSDRAIAARTAFFALFLLAPVLNIFQYDQTETHFMLFGFPLSFNLELAWVTQSSPAEVAGQILFWFVLPITLLHSPCALDCLE